MKVIITGASGMVGKGVLYECLADDSIEQVLIIVRSKIDETHAKLRQVVHEDFSDYSSVESQLESYDACFLCMGVSAAGLSDERYFKLTHTYTLTLAATFLKLNPDSICTYVSGQGTDSSENGRQMWARVKGKTENDLLNLGFKSAFMFRPGIIIPKKGIRSKTKSYQFFYDYFMWLIKIVEFFSPRSIVTTTQMGQAMIAAAREGYDKNIINPGDIIQLSDRSPA